MKNETVIFICSFNSVRSPMAEGFLRHRDVCRHYTVCSAGIAPVRVRPGAAAVMQEMKIDISGHVPASLYQYRNEHFDYVITLCNNVRVTTEEVLTGGDRFIHRDFASPAEIGKTQGEILEEYRRLRDEIGLWIDELFPAMASAPGKNNGEINAGPVISTGHA
jgi:arsenate reductase